MNTQTYLPHLPTEIWDKIFDIKWAIEDKEEHKNKQNMVLEQFNTFINQIDCITNDVLEINVKSCSKLSNGYAIDISLFNKTMIRWIEADEYDHFVYDPLSITDDESDDEYLYD